jgi:hypothetical protein
MLSGEMQIKTTLIHQYQVTQRAPESKTKCSLLLIMIQRGGLFNYEQWWTKLFILQARLARCCVLLFNRPHMLWDAVLALILLKLNAGVEPYS